MEGKFIVQTSTPERLFVKVYRDFLNSGILDGKEQIIFIHLKQYVNFMNDNGTVQDEVYPTLATLAKNVKMTEKTVRTILQSLQKKGILEIKQQGRNKPNIYKINDSAEMWKSESAEELKEAVNEIEEKRMIEILTAKGYHISKEKGLASEGVQTPDTSTNQKNFNLHNDTTDEPESQERYPMDFLKRFFEYRSLVDRNPSIKKDIDIIFNLLYDTLNTQKLTIRVNGEDKERNVVIGKLMKLQFEDFPYAIKKYHEQTGRIKNVKAYLLTILYHAREQSHLDMMNLGHYNGDF